MEAGNLGAYFAGHPDEVLHAAIDDLRRSPSYEGHEAQYVDAARSITRRQPPGAPSLAVATWRFDGEPISQFATDIAKLFQNSVREAGLFSIADAGVVYFDGGFGTLQRSSRISLRTVPPRWRTGWRWSSSAAPQRRAGITLSPRPCPCRPRRTAFRRSHHPR
jgi:hypothetical protein